MATGNPTTTIYGDVEAHLVGQFLIDGHSIEVIRPGYDSQGRRRKVWTQFVWNGVPIYEVKVQCKLAHAIERFELNWARAFDESTPDEIKAALEGARRERTRKFRDGRSGETPAPSITLDGPTGAAQFTN